MSTSTLQSVCRLVVGVAVVALVTHTWLIMGLIVPVTVAGSSMAPALCGPHRNYRCEACHLEFALGLDEWPAATSVCPTCRKWSAVATSDPLLGERLLIDRTAFLHRGPRRWEVVVFRSPENPRELCVKRVVGLPGELVALSEGQFRINGEAIQPPQGLKYEWRYGDTSDAATGWQLGPREYFVLGDNGPISEDSRNWMAGPGVDAELLLGRPLGVR